MADRIPLVISGTSIREIPSSDRLDVQGAMEVNGNITPGTDSAHSIGSASLKFKDLFLSAGTIHLGGIKLRADGNKLSIQDSTGANSSLAPTSQFVSGDSGSSEFLLRVSDALSVVDAGGDGSFAYDSSLGKFTYTGPSASEVRAHFSGTSGVTYNSGTGAITIGQAVAASDSVVFAGLHVGTNATIGGNLTVNGTTTTVNSTNTTITDPLIGLNQGASSNANDLGFIFERGSTGNNAAFIWDETEDKFALGTTTDSAGQTGNLTVSTGGLIANITGNVTGSSGSCTGNAATATALETARAIAVSGDAVGTANFDGTAGISISVALQANTVNSNELASASTLLIKNTAGSTLKTVVGAGN
jgi:hypothetical protein